MIKSLILYFGTLVAGFVGIAGVSKVWGKVGFEEPSIFNLILPVFIDLAFSLLFLVVVGKKFKFSLQRTSIIGLIAILTWISIIIILLFLVPIRR